MITVIVLITLSAPSLFSFPWTSTGQKSTWDVERKTFYYILLFVIYTMVYYMYIYICIFLYTYTRIYKCIFIYV